MSLVNKIQKLREKPQHVRERILLVSIVVIGVVLLIVWYIAFTYQPKAGGNSIFKEIGGTVSNSFNNPVYESTFGPSPLSTSKQ